MNLQAGEWNKGLHLVERLEMRFGSQAGKTFLLVTQGYYGEHNGRGSLLHLMWHYGIRLGF